MHDSLRTGHNLEARGRCEEHVCNSAVWKWKMKTKDHWVSSNRASRWCSRTPFNRDLGDHHFCDEKNEMYNKSLKCSTNEGKGGVNIVYNFLMRSTSLLISQIYQTCQNCHYNITNCVCSLSVLLLLVCWQSNKDQIQLMNMVKGTEVVRNAENFCLLNTCLWEKCAGRTSNLTARSSLPFGFFSVFYQNLEHDNKQYHHLCVLLYTRVKHLWCWQTGNQWINYVLSCVREATCCVTLNCCFMWDKRKLSIYARSCFDPDITVKALIISGFYWM